MSDSEALELALALHASPQRAGQLRARPLPADGVTNLLRLALAQPEAVEDAARETSLSAELLVDAARFFVEQQMLVEACEPDPWRVLGLAPGAAEHRLREHHRLLVSLVHPDRSSDWPAGFADRVNKAWRQLRRPEGRVNAGPSNAALPITESQDLAPYRPSFAAPPRSLLPATATRLRYLPLVLVGGIVLTAATLLWLDGWVTANYGGESALAESDSDVAGAGGRVDRRGVLQTSPDNVSESSPAVVADAPRPSGNAAPAEADNGAALGLLAFFSYLGSTWDAHQRMRTNRDEIDLVEPALAPVAMPLLQRVALARSVPPAAQRRPPQDGTRAEPAVQAVAQVAPPLPPPIAVAAPSVSGPLAAPGSQPAPMDVVASASPASSGALIDQGEAQVRHLLHSFGMRFREGDLLGLLELFALGANADEGGVPSLAAEYSQVFGATRSREIRFDGVHWVLDGGLIRGGARVQIETLAPGRAQRSVSNSRLQFEVQLDGEQARIMRWVASAESEGA